MEQLRDVKAYIPNAPNFTYGEFIKSDTAIRMGIELTPTEEQWQSVELLACNVLQPIRKRWGKLKITSGFRSVELCNAIGSGATSNHTRGEAADIEPLEAKMIDVFQWVAESVDYRELIAEFFPSGWIHVAFRLKGNSKIIKLKDQKHNYIITPLEYILKLYGDG